MKKTGLLGLGIALLILLALTGANALAESAGEAQDEWTVLFYFCGSDLESRYGYATENLTEIANVGVPPNYLPTLKKRYGLEADAPGERGRVNVLIETGGSREWHAQGLGMDISTASLQRWRYTMIPFRAADDGSESFELLETLPLRSMADPGTLSDFIRWGAEQYPAKKYALVLWDHGEGARTGLFIDELFDGDVMYIYGLKQALTDSGVHLDSVIIDACLMANIETAWAIRDCADWMTASEENVPGKGTAMGDWLQQLVNYPECDGKWLGRCVCDTTIMKYANQAEERNRSILTWSVIDLSAVDRLVDSLGGFFRQIGEALRSYPLAADLYMRFIKEAVEYGDGQQNMRDIGSMLYNPQMVFFIDNSLHNDMLKALSDAVVYCVRGPGRSEARGLTFCYPADFSDEELEHYALNFPMSDYLACIDAVSPWTAPDWVYETVERLPGIDTIDTLRLSIQRVMSASGMPALECGETINNVDTVMYSLYRLNEETGEVVRMGKTDCVFDLGEDGDLQWRASDPMHWPSVDGVFICMDVIQSEYDRKLYNVPVMIDSQISVLRLGRDIVYEDEGETRLSDYDIYGVWVGYDENSTLLDRSVKPLAMLMGQEYRLLYPVDGAGRRGREAYSASRPLTMYRRLEVKELPLPAGTYYLQYEVEDVFMRTTLLDRIEIHWDGRNMTFPEGFAWEDDVAMK